MQGQADDDGFAETEIARLSTAIRTDTIWTIQPGPYSHRPCLMATGESGIFEIIAPPGVPLERPERVSAAVRWRYVRRQDGEPLSGPVPLTLAEVLALAPDHRDWALAIAERRDRLARATGRVPMEPVGAALEAEDRPVFAPAVPEHDGTPEAGGEVTDFPSVARTTSASAFARYIRTSGIGSPPARVERLLNRCARESDATTGAQIFMLGLLELRTEVGPTGVRDGILALLHARSRSHSWRYTRALRFRTKAAMRTATGDTVSLRRRLERLIDETADAGEFLKALQSTVERDGRLDGIIERLVYERARDPSWRYTEPIRVMLSSRPLAPLRSFLRLEVHPRCARSRRLS